jgi:predicted kinase/transcriptional regulator with XRE-family HTH domain
MTQLKASSTVTGARRTLGEQLHSLRDAAGITQQRLAQVVGYSRSTVANVEAGRQQVDRSFWERCDDALNADGLLTSGFDEVQELLRQLNRQQAEIAQRARLAQISEWKKGHNTAQVPVTEDGQAREPSGGPGSEVIQQLFLGVEEFDAEGEDLNRSRDLEQRVLTAYQRHERTETQTLSITFVGGFAGSGKSEFSRFLGTTTGWAVLDKDTITRPLVEQLLLSLGCDIHDRHSEVYRTKVRPFEYRCLLDAAEENLSCGISTVVAAPFLREFDDTSWMQRVSNRMRRHNVSMSAVWVKCDVQSMYDYIAHRGAARDAWKLSNWEEYLTSIDPDFEPSFPHYTVDNRLNAAVALADQAREIALRVRNEP